jgi:hypothetical protein
MSGAIPPPQYAFMAWCLVKHRDHFTFTFTFMIWKGNRGSSVSITTRLRAGRPGFNSRKGLGFNLFATSSRPILGPTQPPLQYVQAVPTPGVKRQWRETCHSLLVPRLSMRGSIPPVPQYVFMAWCKVKL